nr:MULTISPECIES: TauD/TfdA family dioxygenase [unclassified Okeania]
MLRKQQFSNQPLIVCFYMVENTTSGGESILVDGFRIAQDFRQQHPRYFQILTETPVNFKQFYTDFKYFYSRAQTVLELDREGQIARVNFGHSHASNWNIPFEQMEKFYEAYCAFFRYLKNPAYQYQVRLQPGNLLLMYNDRILHGRKEFDSNSGIRHLEVAYIAWDYFTARNDFDRYKHLYLEG